MVGERLGFGIVGHHIGCLADAAEDEGQFERVHGKHVPAHQRCFPIEQIHIDRRLLGRLAVGKRDAVGAHRAVRNHGQIELPGRAFRIGLLIDLYHLVDLLGVESRRLGQALLEARHGHVGLGRRAAHEEGHLSAVGADHQRNIRRFRGRVGREGIAQQGHAVDDRAEGSAATEAAAELPECGEIGPEKRVLRHVLQLDGLIL